MTMGDLRLGDIIDDYCVKCKRIMNHAVVSMLNGEPAKVRCRTCHSDHDYRHEQPPPPKVDLRKQALFNEVLAKVAPPAAGEADALVDEPPDDDASDEEMPDEEMREQEEEAPVAAAVAEAKPKKAKAAVKTKTKAKGRSK